jgi:hypothetical protein
VLPVTPRNTENGTQRVEDGVRTRDLHLGKVTRYQLRYIHEAAPGGWRDDGGIRTRDLPALQAGALGHSATSSGAGQCDGSQPSPLSTGALGAIRTRTARPLRPLPLPLGYEGICPILPRAQCWSRSRESNPVCLLGRQAPHHKGFYGMNDNSVGIAGFEPAASPSRRERATKLRHIPLRAPSRSRTCMPSRAPASEAGVSRHFHHRGVRLLE